MVVGEDLDQDEDAWPALYHQRLQLDYPHEQQCKSEEIMVVWNQGYVGGVHPGQIDVIHRG